MNPLTVDGQRLELAADPATAPLKSRRKPGDAEISAAMAESANAGARLTGQRLRVLPFQLE